MNQQIIEEGKKLAMISYLPIFGIVFAYYMNNDKRNGFASFHIRQAIGLWLLYFISAISISNLDIAMLRISLWVFFGSLLIYGFVCAKQGKVQTVPLLGNIFQKVFKSISEF